MRALFKTLIAITFWSCLNLIAGSQRTREPLISTCLSLRYHLGDPFGENVLFLAQDLRCGGRDWRYPLTVVGKKTLKGFSSGNLSTIDLSSAYPRNGGIIIAPNGRLDLDSIVLRGVGRIGDDATLELPFITLQSDAKLSIRRSFILHGACLEDEFSLMLNEKNSGDFHVCGSRFLCRQQIVKNAKYVVDDDMRTACRNDHVDEERERSDRISYHTAMVALGLMAIVFVALCGIAVWKRRSETSTMQSLGSYIEGEYKSTAESDRTVLDFSLPTRRVVFDNFSVDLDEQLGVGGFGTVYTGYYCNKKAAVKALLQKDLPTGANLMTEAGLSVELKHPNVVRTYTAKHVKVKDLFGEVHTHGEDGCVLLFMEYCDKGELSRAIDRGEYVLSHESLKPKLCAILHCALDIANGLEYLHAHGVVHCDLKPDNIVRSTDDLDPRGYVCKICDFGLSKKIDAAMTKTDTLGMISYMPPEMLRKGCIGRFTDIYSFGMLLWELVTSDVPYSEVDYNQILEEATRGRRPIIPDSTPSSIKSLIRACWTSDYKRRPSASDVVQRLCLALSEWYASFPVFSPTISTPKYVRNTWRSHSSHHARSIGCSDLLYSVDAGEYLEMECIASSRAKSFSSYAIHDGRDSMESQIPFTIDLGNSNPEDAQPPAECRNVSKSFQKKRKR